MLRRDCGRRARAWVLVLFTVFAMGLFVPVERADAATETNDDDHWITTDAAVTQTHELVIVNLSTPDYEILVDDLTADRDDGRVFEVVMLDADRGGGQGWFLTLQARLTESVLNPIVDFWGNRMRSTMARRGER